jgi:hypothetical protein
MDALRHCRNLIRPVLLWWVLALGVSVATAIVKPGSLQLVCSGAGTTVLLSVDGDGKKNATSAALGMDCPLCQPAPALPPPTELAADAERADFLLATLAQPPVVAATAPPFPPRAPPTLS